MFDEELSSLQKITLIVIVVSLLGWGIPLLLFPQFLWVTIGGAVEPAATFYSRYSGAWFIGVSIAAIIAARYPARLGAIFDICAIGAVLSFLALIVDYFAGTVPIADWLLWAAIIDTVALTVLSFLSRSKA